MADFEYHLYLSLIKNIWEALKKFQLQKQQSIKFMFERTRWTSELLKKLLNVFSSFLYLCKPETWYTIE